MWVGGTVAVWLAATVVVLPVLGRLLAAGQRVAPRPPAPGRAIIRMAEQE